MEREQPSPPLRFPQQPPQRHRLSAGKASPTPYQSPGHPNPPINESYYTDNFLKACPSLQPRSPVPAVRGLVFRSAVSGREPMPLDRAGFALCEDLGCFFTSCALIPARAQPHLPRDAGLQSQAEPRGSAKLPVLPRCLREAAGIWQRCSGRGAQVV